ncbi:MAG: NifU family protein [Nitrospinota bacterium]|nr:NifU family protein [Nitrospinota bacterium]
MIDNNVTLYQSNKTEKIEVDVLKFPCMSDEEKINAIEMVLNRSIRTNLTQDGGGVEVKGIEGNNVKIHYLDACGSCPTSTTGTLQYIQTQLKQQLHQDLIVQSV